MCKQVVLCLDSVRANFDTGSSAGEPIESDFELTLQFFSKSFKIIGGRAGIPLWGCGCDWRGRDLRAAGAEFSVVGVLGMKKWDW